MPKLYTLLVLFLSVPLLLMAQSQNLKDSKNLSEKKVRDRAIAPKTVEDIQSAIFLEDFNGDNTVSGLTGRGWVFIDNDGAGSTTTFNGNTGVFSAYEGPDTGYVGQNYNGAAGGGLVIDQWLITPQFTVVAGNVFTFYWNSGGGGFDDSVYIRISDGGSTMPDFTLNVGRFKVPDGGWQRFSYEFTTGGTKRVALQYYHTDGGPGGNYSNYWGLDYFEVLPGPGLASGPSPTDGEEILDLNPMLSWTNPAGATTTDVFFGTDPNSLTSVYSGSAVTTYDAMGLDYSTTYYWSVNVSDGTDTIAGDIWSFSVGQNPAIESIFSDDFESGFTNWTAATPNDACDWGFTSGTLPGSWGGAPFLPGSASGNYAFASSDNCGGLMDVTLMGNFSLDLSNYESAFLEFDSDFEVYSAPDPADTARVDVSTDGGASWTEVFVRNADASSEHANVDISSLVAGQSDVKFRLVYYADFSWHWALDNFSISGVPSSIISIAEAIEDLNNDYEPDRLGDTVTVQGVITSPNFQTSNNSFYLQDATAGTDIFMYGPPVFTWALGDMLTITGTVDQYNGTTEIIPLDSADWHFESSGNPVPDPTLLTLAEYKANPEMYEGSLVGFVSLTLVDGTWPTSGSANLSLSDGVDTVVFRIDSDTDIPGQTEPTWPRDVIGIGSQFDSGTPADGGYQIFPRFYGTDFLPPGTIPVELTSFTAKASNNAVILNWSTATETNNRGFEVERKTTDQFVTIGYVDGNGTSTEVNSYSFTDSKVESGTYYYRLKQVDFDGSYEYSPVVEAEILNPVSYSLDQNYPNPFNPSTKINVNLAADSKVKLVVFDILGQEVSTLVNGNLAAGSHEFEFNASNLNSGVYFYRVDATGVDGTNFSSVKKMILTK